MASSLDIVNVKKMYPDATLPTRGSKMAAGYDLYAYIEEGNVLIPPHSTILVGTGVAIQPPKDTFGAVFARSGLATKQGLRPANCVGVCDYDYTGEYIVAIHNDSNEERVINNGENSARDHGICKDDHHCGGRCIVVQSCYFYQCEDSVRIHGKDHHDR